MVAYLAVAAVAVVLLAICFGWLHASAADVDREADEKIDRLGRKHDALGRFTK